MVVNNFCAAALLAGLCLVAGAEELPSAPRAAAIGDDTRALLELQRSGRQAGAELPMLGAASVLSYQRYLESHKTRIPENMSSLINRGGSSSGGGSSR